MTRVAFVGLGVMGFPMAGHLADKGHEVTVFNRTAAEPRNGPRAIAGGRAATPREAAERAEIVFICVGNDDDLRSVVLRRRTASWPAWRRAAIVVDHTTASADVARELAEAAAASSGAHFIDAPVSGGQAGAENGTLTIMCGGEPDAVRTRRAGAARPMAGRSR